MKYLTVFGLPTSNTEYCQILPNTIWELALKTTLTRAITQANNWYSRVQTIHHEIKSIYSSILNSFLLTYFTASLLMLTKTITTCATELATSFQHAGAIYPTVFTAQSCTQTKRNIMCYSKCDLTCSLFPPKFDCFVYSSHGINFCIPFHTHAYISFHSCVYKLIYSGIWYYFARSMQNDFSFYFRVCNAVFLWDSFTWGKCISQ